MGNVDPRLMRLLEGALCGEGNQSQTLCEHPCGIKTKWGPTNVWKSSPTCPEIQKCTKICVDLAIL